MWLAANAVHVLFDIHPLRGVRLQLSLAHVFPLMFPRHLWDVVTLRVELDDIPYLPFVYLV